MRRCGSSMFAIRGESRCERRGASRLSLDLVIWEPAASGRRKDAKVRAIVEFKLSAAPDKFSEDIERTRRFVRQFEHPVLGLAIVCASYDNAGQCDVEIRDAENLARALACGPITARPKFCD